MLLPVILVLDVLYHDLILGENIQGNYVHKTCKLVKCIILILNGLVVLKLIALTCSMLPASYFRNCIVNS